MVRLLMHALVVLLLVGSLAAAAPSAAAEATVEARPASTPGYISFVARDFRENGVATTWLTAPDQGVIPTEQVTANNRGEITFELLMRRYYQPGRWAITIQELDSDRKAITYFDVVARGPDLQAQVSPSSGAAGTTFNFATTEFGRGEQINWYFTGPDGVAYPGGEGGATNDGRVDFRFTPRPGTQPGLWTASIYGQETDRLAVVSFTLTS